MAPTEQTLGQKVLVGLRWTVALPASILGSLIAYWVILFLNHFSIARYADPNSFMFRTYIEAVCNAIMGAAFVYISVQIVPSYKKQTGIVLAGLVLLASGAILFASYLTQNYWAMWAVVWVNAGAIAIACDVFNRETQREETESLEDSEGIEG